jgi:hypothetical protein
VVIGDLTMPPFLFGTEAELVGLTGDVVISVVGAASGKVVDAGVVEPVLGATPLLLVAS